MGDNLIEYYYPYLSNNEKKMMKIKCDFFIEKIEYLLDIKNLYKYLWKYRDMNFFSCITPIIANNKKDEIYQHILMFTLFLYPNESELIKMNKNNYFKLPVFNKINLLDINIFGYIIFNVIMNDFYLDYILNKENSWLQYILYNKKDNIILYNILLSENIKLEKLFLDIKKYAKKINFKQEENTWHKINNNSKISFHNEFLTFFSQINILIWKHIITNIMVFKNTYTYLKLNNNSNVNSSFFFWLKQIEFYYIYFHNRVLFIDGDTGVGKSTNTPNMLLHAQKICQYINYNKISIMSFPTKLAVNNAYEFINNKQIFIQLTSDKKEYIDSKRKLPLFILTVDAILKDFLIYKYPFCYEFSEQKNKIIKEINHIIIDEIHMNTIAQCMNITLMQKYMKYNTNVKLILVSATLSDEDRISINNFIFSENINSYHIMFPNLNTEKTFYIEDIYLNTDEYYEDTFLFNQKMALSILFKNINCLPNKNAILIFDIGSKSIDYLVNYLNNNNNIPEDIIVLPLYSQLNDAYRDLFKLSIDNFLCIINSYITSRTKLQSFLNQKHYSSINNNSKELKFKRIIIISTNIAETAITIPFLWAVIETGFQKYLDNISGDMIIIPIDESSRIQRRGRVGRISNGKVFYTYKEKQKKKNISKYEVEDKNVYHYILDFITNDLYRINKTITLSSGFTFDELINEYYVFRTNKNDFHSQIKKLVKILKRDPIKVILLIPEELVFVKNIIKIFAGRLKIYLTYDDIFDLKHILTKYEKEIDEETKQIINNIHDINKIFDYIYLKE